MDMMVVDANTDALGISKALLMENAGKCVAQKIFEISKPCKINIYAGTGGNGGDGFVAARYLHNHGFEVELFLIGHQSHISSYEALRNWEVLSKLNIETNNIILNIIEDHSKLVFNNAELVIDAILGTGTQGKLRKPVSKAIDIINNSNCTVIAVDIPTGMDPETGIVEYKAVKADYTITFHKKKNGLNNADKEYVGNIIVCDIGIPLEAELFTGPGDLLRRGRRDEKSHKGQNGKVLVIGGSKEYSGAPALAALAALGGGADISVVACPQELSSIIRSYSPDLIVHRLSNEFLNPKDTEELIKLSEKFDAVVLGCGIGREEETALAVNDLVVEIGKPMVIDADALKMLGPGVIPRRIHDTVITPHTGEFHEFSGRTPPQDMQDKMEMVKEVALESESTVLL